MKVRVSIFVFFGKPQLPRQHYV